MSSSTANGSCSNITDVIPSGNERQIQLLQFIFMIMVPLTIVLNVAVIFRINLRRKHRFFTRLLLSSLAVVDFCVGTILMPFNITSAFYDVRTLVGSHTCSLITSIDVLLSSASTMHLSLLSYERYIAICKPFAYEHYCGKKQTLIMYVLCWIFVSSISFGIIMPGFHHIGVDKNYLKCFKENNTSCVFVMNVFVSMLCSTGAILLPAFVITVFNAKLFLTIRRNNVTRIFHLNVVSRNNARKSLESMRVARTIFVLTGCFFICWLPFFVVLIMHTLQRGRELSEYVIVQWLGYMNSAVNPFLYLLMETRSNIGRSSTQR